MYEYIATYEHVLVWAGLALLLLLCLPFAGIHKLVLEAYGWALRLALLALLVAAGVLWFRPELLPAEVRGAIDRFPELRAVLPEPGARAFGAAVAGLVTAVLLPFLAVLDVTRKLAGRRLRRLRALTAAPRVEAPAPAATAAAVAPVATAPPPEQQGPAAAPSPAPRRGDRRSAAETMASVGSGKPFRVSDHVS